MFDTVGIGMYANAVNEEELAAEIGRVAAQLVAKADRCLKIGDEELGHHHLRTAGLAARFADRRMAAATGGGDVGAPIRLAYDMFAREAFEKGWASADPIALAIVEHQKIDLGVIREFASARSELHTSLEAAADAYEQLRRCTSLEKYREKARQISALERIPYRHAAERVAAEAMDEIVKNDDVRYATAIARDRCRAASELIHLRPAGPRPPRNPGGRIGEEGLLDSLKNIEEINQRLSLQTMKKQPIFDEELNQLLLEMREARRHLDDVELPPAELRELAQLIAATCRDASEQFRGSSIAQVAADFARELVAAIVALLAGAANGLRGGTDQPQPPRTQMRPR